MRHAFGDGSRIDGGLPPGNAHADLNQQTGRDVRLDLFRGLSLFFIFIDHIPNNVLSYVTLRSIGFSDAAEVFDFISGYAAATVYGKALRRQGSIFAHGPDLSPALRLLSASSTFRGLSMELHFRDCCCSSSRRS